MPLLDHFDLVAPLYDRVIGFQSPERLISLAQLPVEGLLLDAGGGTGRVSFAVRKLVSQVVVADLSFHMLRQAGQKDGLGPVNALTEALPFRDHTFDRIIMIDALHHVCDQGITARELWRLIKPGGRIVIEEPDIRTMIVKIVALAEKMALMRSHFLAPQEIAGLFSFPGARTRITRESYNAWIVVEKDT